MKEILNLFDQLFNCLNDQFPRSASMSLSNPEDAKKTENKCHKCLVKADPEANPNRGELSRNHKIV